MQIAFTLKKIRQFISDPNAQPDAELTVAAEDYATACRSVERRAARCLDLIANGMFVEAAYLAEIEPALFDQQQKLNFPELAQWQNSAEMNGLALPPPPLPAQQWQKIDHAVTQSSDLKNLLVRQRLLALRRAPIAERLRAQWDLQKAHPQHRPFTDDAIALENLRLLTIKTEAETAYRQRNLSALEEIYWELAQPDWNDSAALTESRETVTEKSNEVRREKTVSDYENLAEKIQLAHADNALTRAENLRKEWDGILASTHIKPASAQKAAVASAFRWLDRERESREHRADFERACAALELAVEQDAAPEEIERQLRFAESFEIEIPERLLFNAEHRLSKHATISRRKFVLRIFRVCGLLVLVLALIGLSAWYYQREKIARDWKEKITVAVQQNHLAQAREMLAQLRDSDVQLYDSPEIQELIANCATREKDENERREKLEELLPQLTAGDLAILPTLLTLARSPDEKEKIAAAKNHAVALLVKNFDERQIAVSELTNALAVAVKNATDFSALPAQAEEAIAEFRALRDWADAPDRALYLQRDQLDEIGKITAKLQKEITQKIAQKSQDAEKFLNAKKRIVTAVAAGNLPMYRNYLREYYATPEYTSPHFSIAKIPTIFERLQAFENMEEARKALLAQLDNALNEKPFGALPADFSKRMDALTKEITFGEWEEKIRRRVAKQDMTGKAVQNEFGVLKKYLDSPLIKELWQITETRNGIDYFAYVSEPDVNEATKNSNGSWNIRYYRTDLSRPQNFIDGRKRRLAKTPEITPHSRFAKQLLEKLDAPEFSPTFFVNALTNLEIAARTPGFEPAAHLRLSKRLFAMAKFFSDKDGTDQIYNLDRELNDLIEKQLRAANSGGDIEWTLVADDDINRRKAEIAKRLKALITPRILEEIKRQTIAELAQLKTSAPPSYRWVGVLTPIGDAWKIADVSASPKGARQKLFALDQNGEMIPLATDDDNVENGDWFFGQPVIATDEE